MTSRRYTLLMLAMPFILYLLALNPFLAPDTYDNVVYFEGAQALANHGTYQSGGEWITDWPPMLSSLLAIPMLLGLGSVWVAKIIILLTVLLGIFFAYRLLVQEDRPWPLLSCFFCLLTPVGFLWGGRIMSEWPYLMFSFLFLNLLGELRKRYSWSLVVFSGIVLGASLLTRHIGVTLIAALAVQAWEKLRRDGYKRIWPEASVFAIGSVLYTCLWLLPVAWIRSSLGAHSKYYQNMDFIVSPKPLEMLTVARDFFFFDSAWKGFSGLWMLSLALSIVVVICLWGLILSFYRGKNRPTDTYVIALLGLFTVHYVHWSRFMLVIGPLLFCYLFLGLSSLGNLMGRSTERMAKRIGVAVLILYGLGLFSMDVHLLARGNGRTYNGLNYLASPSAESYYAGEWRDLYLLCQKVRQDPAEGDIAVYDLGETRYVHYFTGRRVVAFETVQSARFVMASTEADLISKYPDLGLLLIDTIGRYSLYQVNRE